MARMAYVQVPQFPAGLKASDYKSVQQHWVQGSAIAAAMLNLPLVMPRRQLKIRISSEKVKGVKGAGDRVRGLLKHASMTLLAMMKKVAMAEAEYNVARGEADKAIVLGHLTGLSEDIQAREQAVIRLRGARERVQALKKEVYDFRKQVAALEKAAHLE
ncbi:hypothetical protein BV22DRAFT_1051907 [Leucogyrophana mollusca]|uniref:Uncharacterized protein n=1 Tax=Leucogyrophana mollusca TaxID=85980 RepID=A0ACB8B0G6_9AGAM|nr:hypothetical protein BV22DRAFT_1051907 [Leucogyrophana mollusca]